MSGSQYQIDSSRVIARGFSAIGGNFPSFLVVALALAGVPSFAMQYALASDFLDIENAALVYWSSMVLWWLLAALLQAILVRATALHFGGRGSSMMGSVALGFQLLLPIVAISLLVLVGMAIGLVLLIVPGFVFYIMMIVSIPALVEERRGIFGSMARSYRLTRGSYLQIFVLLVLFLMFWALIATGFSLVFGVSGFGLEGGDPLTSAAATALTSTMNAMIAAAMIASLHLELRIIKEGATGDGLAAIFE